MTNVTTPRTPVLIITAARRVQVSVQTVKNWISKRYIRGYLAASGQVMVDLDEIEQALLTNHRMRDGRRSRFGGAPLTPLPVQVAVVTKDGETE